MVIRPIVGRVSENGGLLTADCELRTADFELLSRGAFHSTKIPV